MRGIVTPEAVLLEFQTASVATRVLQFSLDVLIQLAALTAALLVFAAAGSTGIDIPESVAVIFVVVAFFLVLLGYPIAMEALWNGRTLGMAAVGLRVVTTEGAPIRFRHAAIRGALGLIDFWLIPVGVVATIVILLTRDNQRLGDLAAGTLVLRERTPVDRTAQAMAFYPPYGLEPYAAGLDVTTVTPEQYEVLRSYLLRVTSFTPEARWSLGARLANPVATEMGHTPPANLAPETFLVCVAAAYQLRHGGPPGGWPTHAPQYGGPVPTGVPPAATGGLPSLAPPAPPPPPPIPPTVAPAPVGSPPPAALSGAPSAPSPEPPSAPKPAWTMPVAKPPVAPPSAARPATSPPDAPPPSPPAAPPAPPVAPAPAEPPDGGFAPPS